MMKMLSCSNVPRVGRKHPTINVSGIQMSLAGRHNRATLAVGVEAEEGLGVVGGHLSRQDQAGVIHPVTQTNPSIRTLTLDRLRKPAPSVEAEEGYGNQRKACQSSGTYVFFNLMADQGESSIGSNKFKDIFLWIALYCNGLEFFHYLVWFQANDSRSALKCRSLAPAILRSSVISSSMKGLTPQCQSNP
jgi:hypothetical protein